METIHEDMCEFFQDRFIWIDHHISAINENYTEYKGIRDTKFAACELTWKTLFPDIPVPIAVQLLSAYDVWNKSRFDWDKMTLPFQYGMRLICNKPEKFPMELFENDDLIVLDKPAFVNSDKIKKQYKTQNQ